MELTPERIKLLRAVLAQIKAAPERYDQAHYLGQSACGTRHCIAGWTCALSGKYSMETYYRGGRDISFVSVKIGIPDSPFCAARGLLGLTMDEADTLFDATGIGWPDPFGDQWDEVNRRVAFTEEGDPKAYADIAVRYLEHIIQTGKVDA